MRKDWGRIAKDLSRAKAEVRKGVPDAAKGAGRSADAARCAGAR